LTNASAETPQFYAAGEPIFPRGVSGRARTPSWWIRAVTSGICLDRLTATPGDRVLVLEPTASGYAAIAGVAPDGWRAEIVTTAAHGTSCHEGCDPRVTP
jgi:hypothetical protein